MKIALVGIGKIAVDQHVPAIAGSDTWELAATASRNGSVAGVEAFASVEALLEARPDIPVISLCLPPVPRFEAAQAALRAGRHVMLEKPPGASLAECHALRAMAEAEGVSLYASWHSRAADKVAAAKAWLAGRVVDAARVDWREDVRKWHPGQDWVFDPGGMGVFDPGINGLSILTEILPQPVHLERSVLEFPANRQTPIAAELVFSGGVTAGFDWRETKGEVWSIRVEAGGSVLELHDGGARLVIDGVEAGAEADAPLAGEYPRLYAQMAELVRDGRSDMDLAPFVHVADAFMLGERRVVDPFSF